MISSNRGPLLGICASMLAAFLLLCTPVQAQWAQCPGPEGGTVLSIATLGSTTFIGTLRGGLFRSSDEGASWFSVPLGRTNSEQTTISVDGSNLFVAGDSLYRSTDTGKSWVSDTLPGAPVLLHAIGNSIILVTTNLVYRSSDLGLSWEWNGISNDCFLSHGGVVFGGTKYDGFNRSLDSGATWIRIEIGGQPFPQVLSLAALGRNVYAGCGADQGVLRSTDDGITWARSNQGLINLTDTTHFATVTGLFQDADTLYALTYSGIFTSIDSGASWRFRSPLTPDKITRSGTHLLAALDGISRSVDGGAKWIQSIVGLNASDIVALYRLSSRLFGASSSGVIYRSDDSGRSWHSVSALRYPAVEFTSIDSVLFAATAFECFRSKDFGEHWESTGKKAHWPCTALGNTLVANGDSVYRSTDKGVSWRGLGIPDRYPFEEAFSVGGILYGSEPSNDCGGIDYSIDSGATWIAMNKGLGCIRVTSLCTDDQYLYLGAGAGFAGGVATVYRKKLGDSTWTLATDGLLADSFGTVGTILSTNGEEFVCVYGRSILDSNGVYISTDRAGHWNLANDGLRAKEVETLCVAPPYLFAGTMGGGIWRRPLSEFRLTVATNQASHVGLITANPNPLRSNTTIRYTTEARAHAVVTIANVLGVEVAHLFAGDLLTGEHLFTWDAKGMPKGMYLCIVRTGDTVHYLNLDYAN